MKRKIVRIVTVPQSFGLFKGQMNYMKDYFEFIGVSSNGKSLKEIEQNEEIRIKVIELTRKISPIKDFVSLVKLILFLRKEKPHIVHSHTPKAGTIGMLAAYFLGIKHRVHTVAGLPLMESTGLTRIILEVVERITYFCSTQVLPNSNGLKKFILEQGYTSEKKINVIANGSTNGIDTDYFCRDKVTDIRLNEIKSIHQIKENDFVFLFVGRVVKDKGIVELVNAFKRFNDQNTYSKLVILGDFEKELDPLPDFIENEILNNASIIFCGFQNDVRSYYALADLFIFPSYREGFPNVVLQAGAMNLPSIVTNINGSNEIIINGTNGLIIPVKNEMILFEKMVYLYKNKSILSNMRYNCRSLIKGRYEQVLVWDEVYKMYNSMI